MPRIVVGSPVSRSPAILREFLGGLARLRPDGCELQWIFVDDNGDPESSTVLHDFMRERAGEVLLPPPRDEPYPREEAGQRWTVTLIERVAAHKDRILARALEIGADAVFLVDSDLVLHPRTLEVLRAADVDIVSEVFWTRYEDTDAQLPNVWMTDNYTLFSTRGDPPPEEDAARAAAEFLARLSKPGVHRVGGLGACTLIRRAAIERGIRFALLPNISWAEDRHFCIRAAVLGFGLWADSHLPPLHLYRSAQIGELGLFRAAEDELSLRWDVLCQARRTAGAECARAGATLLDANAQADLALRMKGSKQVSAQARGNVAVGYTRTGDKAEVDVEVELSVATQPPWQATVLAKVIVEGIATQPTSVPDAAVAPTVVIRRRVPILLSMIVRNEANRYLREVLGVLAEIADDAVIVDDASTDNSAEMCRDLLSRLPHQVEVLPESLFHREHELRARQWELALARKPAWILNLDADELLEARAVELLPRVVESARGDVIGLRLFDMWDRDHYREDALWSAHERFWPMLARPRPGAPATWKRSNQHCGRWPLEVLRAPMECTSLRIQHLGWMSAEDRVAKYERYKQLDPAGRDGWPQQYESILDPDPRLVVWR